MKVKINISNIEKGNAKRDELVGWTSKDNE